MFRYILLAIIIIHGLIHLLGPAKAFHWAEVTQLTQPISRLQGWGWLLVTVLFAGVGILYLQHNTTWFWWAIPAIVVSQGLIFQTWQDARFGTIANVLIGLGALLAWASWSFEQEFRADVRAAFAEQAVLPAPDLLTEADLAPLPEPVQRYLRYTGCVNKPKVQNFKVVFSGEMRSKSMDWFSFTSEQYNFISGDPKRLFFMKGKIKGLLTPGYHAYQNGQASMLIKALGLIPVVKLGTAELFPAETVTVFNDMCLLAPATLIDSRIQWKPIDSLSAQAVFTNGNTSISAILYFNEAGALVDFGSDDRYDVNASQKFHFTTPVDPNYAEFQGYRLLKSGEAVWHYPEGPFTYGKFQLKVVAYNVKE
ncbi:MAG: hypothetical protein H6555_06855 [Lewinellaceae bacterium]|nr:hypothetical protein [Lewinellaceae bacterium]